MKNVWASLNRPIFALAPMEDVTDTVFRQIIDKYAPAELYFTEFTSVDALLSEKGKESAMQRLRFDRSERPIIAQIWGTNPKYFAKSAELIEKLGFDGIDINMGCPVRDIVKTGACSALINNHKLAASLISATRQSTNLPISVKTRLGTDQIQTEEWVGFLLKQGLDAIALHGRTAKEMSKSEVHWDEIAKAVRLRDQIAPQTLILGNGDVLSHAEGLEKVDKYRLDGVMIGRGVFQNLFVFSGKSFTELSQAEKFKIMQEHIELFDKTWGTKKNYNILKKFFKIYISGVDGASDMRIKFMETKNAAQALVIIKEFLSKEDVT